MCNGITKSGKPCSRKAEWCAQHINKKPAPVVEEHAPVIEEKNEEMELFEVAMEIVLDNIVPPMSPNTTSITSLPTNSAIVEESKSAPVEINSESLFCQCRTYLTSNATGRWHESYTMYDKTDKSKYLYKPMAEMSLLRIENKLDDKRRFYWLYNPKDAKAFNEYVALRLRGECHEIIMSPRCRFFFDIDLKLDEMEKCDIADAMGYPLGEGDDEILTMDYVSKKLADIYSRAITTSLDGNGALDDLAEFDWMATTRNRKIDNDGFKISIHLITNLMLPHEACAAIAKDIQENTILENADAFEVPESVVDLVAGAIDPAQYRKHGSLGLPFGMKGGVASFPIRDYAIPGQSYFLTKSDQFCVDDIVMKHYDVKSVVAFAAEANGDFVKQALENISAIPDYSKSAFDLTVSRMKGSCMIVKRRAPSNCSFCNRRHDNDNTLKLFFDSKNGYATWNCIRSSEKSKCFFRIADPVNDNDIEAFAQRTLKPVAEKVVKPVASKKPIFDMDDAAGDYLADDFEELLRNLMMTNRTMTQTMKIQRKEKAYAAIYKFVESFDRRMIRENNGLEFNDLLMKTDEAVTPKEIATLIRQTIVRIENNGESAYFVKVMDERKYGRDYVSTITYMPRDKKNLLEYIFGIKIDGTLVSLKLCEILIRIKSLITYRKSVLEPFGAFEKDTSYERRKNFNLFGGFANQYDESFVVDDNIVKVWIDHIKLVLANNDEKVYQHLLKYFTHLLMNPMVKTGLVVVVKGRQGSGKNSAFDIFYRFVLGANLSITTANMGLITGRFNSMKQSLIASCLDEAVDNKDRPGMNKFKNLITSDETQIEYKCKEPFNVKDFVNYVVISNQDFATFIEESDRRALCIETNDSMIGNREYFKHYWDTLNNEDAGKHIFHWLLRNVDISDWNPQDIPRTEYKQSLKRVQASSSAKFLLSELERLEAGNRSPDGYEYVGPEFDALSDEYKAELCGTQTLSPTELWNRYNVYAAQSKIKSSMSRATFDKDIQHYLPTKKTNGRRVKKYSIESLKEALVAYL